MNLPLNIDWQQILLHLLNFLLLAVGLYLLLYKPVQKFMKKRMDYYEEQEKEATLQKEEAEKMKETYGQILEHASEEMRQMRMEEMNKLTEETMEILGQAKKQATKILTDAEKEAHVHQKKITKGAQRDIVDMVVIATEKLMFQEQSEQNDLDIYDKFLSSIKEGDPVGDGHK